MASRSVADCRRELTSCPAWGGLDTLIVNAGVPTFRPFCELAGLEAKGRTFTPAEADAASIQRAVQTVENVTKTNYIGPVVSAATFVSVPLVYASAPTIFMLVVPPDPRSFFVHGALHRAHGEPRSRRPRPDTLPLQWLKSRLVRLLSSLGS